MTTSETRMDEPTTDRPRLPEGYGTPETDEGLLPWSWASDQLAPALHYWVSTTRPDGRPHAMPTWGVWLDDTFYFDGSSETRRMRNLAANPGIVVHLENGQEAVILEGEAHEQPKPTPELAGRLVEAFAAKYADRDYTPTADQWDNGGLWAMRPTKAFGWSEFPKTVTRWRFSKR